MDFNPKMVPVYEKGLKKLKGMVGKTISDANFPLSNAPKTCLNKMGAIGPTKKGKRVVNERIKEVMAQDLAIKVHKYWSKMDKKKKKSKPTKKTRQTTPDLESSLVDLLSEMNTSLKAIANDISFSYKRLTNLEAFMCRIQGGMDK